MNIRIPFAPTPLLDLSPFYVAAQPPPGRPIIHIGDGYLELTPRIGAAVAEVHRG